MERESTIKSTIKNMGSCFDYDIIKETYIMFGAAIYLRTVITDEGPKFCDRLAYSFTNGYITSYNDWLNGKK